MFKIYCFIIFLLISCFSFAFNTGALPLELHADSADINQNEHTGKYTGTVEFDQGTTHVRAASATTQSDENNKLIAAVIYGDKVSQAHYWTQPNLNKPSVHAYADVIYYDVRSDLIRLVGHAKIVQGENSFTAPEITYNLKKQHLVSTQDKNSNGRTLIIFHPAGKSDVIFAKPPPFHFITTVTFSELK